MIRYYSKVGSNLVEVDETDKGPDEGWIEMSGPRPECIDYTAKSDGNWEISQTTIFANLTIIENQWREEQITRIAKQLLMIEDENPKAEPGTARQWRQYRIAVMDWVEGENPDFPDEAKRPLAPK